MDNRTALSSFVRVIRAFAEASVVALGFVLAILAIGTPIALIVRGLHESLSWLARLHGDPSAIVEALVSLSSVAGGVILTAVLIRLVVGFFHWRRRFRARVISEHPANARSHRHHPDAPTDQLLVRNPNVTGSRFQRERFNPVFGER
jgi:hypothetical protein